MKKNRDAAQDGTLSVIDAYEIMAAVPEGDDAQLTATIDTILKGNPDSATLVSLAAHRLLSDSALVYFANRIAEPHETDTPDVVVNMAWGILSNTATTDEIAQAVIHAISCHVASATDPDLAEHYTIILFHKVAKDPIWSQYLTENDWSRVLIYSATN